MCASPGPPPPGAEGGDLPGQPRERAIVAVGHTMLEMMDHILRGDVACQELGHDDLDKLPPHRLTRCPVKRLESLGHELTLAPVDRAA